MCNEYSSGDAKYYVMIIARVIQVVRVLRVLYE